MYVKMSSEKYVSRVGDVDMTVKMGITMTS